ncbi:MAG: SCO family protein [Patulibacter sp.]|nr:SCO family protein [Patulibacter sp.]
MNARIRLSLLVTAVVVLGVVAVLSLTRSGTSGDQLATGIASASSPYVGATRPTAPSPEFRLRDQDGKLVSIEDFRGRPVIVTFLFANCDDTCPAAARQIAGALDQLDEPVPTLAISVDPANDTPAATQRFLNKMRLGSRARFLLGDEAALKPVWDAYGILPQGPEFDHSAYVLVVDAQGLQRVAFPVDKLTSEGLAHDVRAVQEQPPATPAKPTSPSPVEAERTSR